MPTTALAKPESRERWSQLRALICEWDPIGVLAVARRLRTWFDLAWRDLAEPATIFVALLDEGVDVWRPVQARPLGSGLFRIVGVEADVSDERWQFSAGAVVRCEERRFGDGTTGVAAVDQVEGAGVSRRSVG